MLSYIQAENLTKNKDIDVKEEWVRLWDSQGKEKKQDLWKMKKKKKKKKKLTLEESSNLDRRARLIQTGQLVHKKQAHWTDDCILDF